MELESHVLGEVLQATDQDALPEDERTKNDLDKDVFNLSIDLNELTTGENEES